MEAGQTRAEGEGEGGIVKKLSAPIPRVALTPPEAAAALGVGPDFFAEHVLPELGAVIYRGRKRLIPVAELEQWCERSAESVLERREPAC